MKDYWLEGTSWRSDFQGVMEEAISFPVGFSLGAHRWVMGGWHRCLVLGVMVWEALARLPHGCSLLENRWLGNN